MQIRDEYTKHKHLSTLQDKYMSYVPEEMTEDDLWRVIPVETKNSDSSPDDDSEVVDIVEKYRLGGDCSVGNGGRELRLARENMVAVAIREPVLEAATAQLNLRTDGGLTVEANESDPSNEGPDDCDCPPLIADLPCWPCYRDGFEETDLNVREDG